jgi:FtsP/CotA-like multicopper oxidase with cupredoxin domain
MQISEQNLRRNILQWRPRSGQAAWIIGIGLACVLQPAIAAELHDPPICSAAKVGDPALKDICSVTPLGDNRNDVRINLTAGRATIDVGGYKVTTENYNGKYLAPIVEAMPGDTVSAHLVNALPVDGHSGGMHEGNPTNLHYFHGGIVSPNNARPTAAELGTGDNIYVRLESGKSFDYTVPIPGKTSISGNEALDARVLEKREDVPGQHNYIPHPSGLNWYHSHQHGTSADQVMGGLSGLLSVGEATDNVVADCEEDQSDKTKCRNDIAKDTDELRKRTVVKYALLRDIPLKEIAKLPGEANGDAATFDLDAAARDFSTDASACGVWDPKKSKLDFGLALRAGFCQRTEKTALLFTVNGQRYPTISVEGGNNLLLRLGNLSANLPYWLELRKEKPDGTAPQITILSLDGVVPAAPVAPGQTQKPVQAVDYDNVLVMPASRAEIYVRNDQEKHDDSQTYILWTKKHVVAGSEEWPEIQLLRIELRPNVDTSKVKIALNATVVSADLSATRLRPQALAATPEPKLLPGCVRDLNPELREYRRVTFSGVEPNWAIKTEIVQPKAPAKQEFQQREVDVSATIGAILFEKYMVDGHVNWSEPHVCIFIDDGNHAGSHTQLWVLNNQTQNLHNFHIHQMKFRLATAKDLAGHFVAPPAAAHTCGQSDCTDAPNYDLYDDQTAADVDPGKSRLWHDTIPMPPGQRVFLVMSFDARQQIGRFVFHCHILKHEDKGLMAPIEVWNRATAAALQH